MYRPYADLKQKNEKLVKREFSNNISKVRSYPTTIGIAVNEACNVHCEFCLSQRKTNERIEWNHLKKLEPLFPYVGEVIFSGEEVILHPDIWDMFKTFSNNGIFVNFFTNGKALEPKKMAWLVDQRVGHISCSFHAATPKTYHSIVHGADFNAIIRNFKYLKEYRLRKRDQWGCIPGPGLSFHYVMMRRNIEELPKFLELAALLGADRVIAKYMFVQSHTKHLVDECLLFYPELTNKILDHCTAKALKLPLSFCPPQKFAAGKQATQEHGDCINPLSHTVSPTPCTWPWRQCNIATNGDVQPCCGGLPPMGNIYETDFDAIWNGKKYIDLRATVNTSNRWAGCTKCKYFVTTDVNDIHTHIRYSWDEDKRKVTRDKWLSKEGRFTKVQRLFHTICSAADNLMTDFSEFSKKLQTIITVLPSAEANYLTNKITNLKRLDKDTFILLMIRFLNRFEYSYQAYLLTQARTRLKDKSLDTSTELSRLYAVEDFCSAVSIGYYQEALDKYRDVGNIIDNQDSKEIGLMWNNQDWESIRSHLNRYAENALDNFLTCT